MKHFSWWDAPTLRWLRASILAAGLVWMGTDLARAQTPTSSPTAEPAASAASAAFAAPGAKASALYLTHCATCHGEQRTGGMGPALLPESLERLKPAEALRVISQGRVATQMPGFSDRLSAPEIAALAQHLRVPVVPAPRWQAEDIRASRINGPAAPANEPQRPRWSADPMNLFVVVEAGDHHVSLLDGDRFTVIERFASRYALHGGPKFTPDGRYVFFGSRDGWITKYDLWRLRVVAEVRAGLNMRNVAVSSDGRWVMAANYWPHTLALFDADLQLQQVYDAATADRRETSRVSAVYDAAPRKSFVVAMKDIPELWEISYDRQAEPIYDGLVHDFRSGEALARPGYLGVRRTRLDSPLDDFFFDPDYRHVIGTTRAAPRASQPAVVAAAQPAASVASAPGDVASAPVTAQTPASGSRAQVIHLDARRKVAELPLAGMPHLGSGITFMYQGERVLASPNLQDGAIDVISLKTWQAVGRIAMPGPGFFIRSHEDSRYAWADSMMSPSAKDTLTLIDKQSLQATATVRVPGQTLAHVEFTKNGRYALASVWEDPGALIVYDAQTLQEVKRLPMRKPVGKYNVWNKITRSEGTSH